MIKKDNIYSTPHEQLNQFTFDEQVADVFTDMINRSVPGYQTIIGTIPSILSGYVKPSSLVYDIGCSLGAASLLLAKANTACPLSIHAIDYSDAMVEKAKRNVQSYKYSDTIKVHQADILTFELASCDAIIMNFTLQFIPPAQRAFVVQKIADALPSGQIFVFSEKIHLRNDIMNHKISDLHYDFKRNNGYSELEISQKRTALEDVMIIDSIDTHHARIKAAGFSHCEVWYQHFNFASFIAIK